MAETATQPASVSLGKGAWDCDLNVAIPPEKEVRLAGLCIMQYEAVTHIYRLCMCRQRSSKR